jgi:hypothetical protein
MRAILLLLLTLAGCPTSKAPEGAWQSNRDLTLAEFRGARSFSQEQWKLLSAPTFFGHMIYVFSHDSVVTVYDGECSEPMRYEMDASHARIRLLGAPSDANPELTLESDRLYVPVAIAGGKLRETFTPVDLQTAIQRYPCIRKALDLS